MCPDRLRPLARGGWTRPRRAGPRRSSGWCSTSSTAGDDLARLLRYLVANDIRLGIRPHAAPIAASWSGGARTGRRVGHPLITRSTPAPICFGRRPTDPRREAPGRPRDRPLVVPMDECLVLIPDQLPATSPGSRYDANQQRLAREPAPGSRPEGGPRRGRRCWPGWWSAAGAGSG